jgi:hypothetical protein
VRYDHTQYGPLHLIVAAVGVVLLVGAAVPIVAVRFTFLVAGGLVFLLAASLRRLTVRGEDDRLRLEFGPLPLFRKSVPYAEIKQVKRGGRGDLDGWGVILSPDGGWTWSLWGHDCVVLRLTDGKRLTIGTDDADGLAAYLGRRLAEEQMDH